MGLPCCKWFIISVWCISGIYAYSIRPVEDNNEPINLEKDFFFSYEPRKFFDTPEEEEKMFDTAKIEPTKPPADNQSTPLDSWSVVWYIASFGGLIVFFLIVSCSEWCCRRAIRNSQSCSRNAPAATTPSVPDTPPPSYDQFAPPSYESICLGRSGRSGEKSEYDIYVVPVHAFGPIMESRQEDAPPSYFSASAVTENSQVSRVT